MNVQGIEKDPGLSFQKLPPDYEVRYMDERKPSEYEEREIKEKILISGDLRPEDDTKRLVEADIYIQVIVKHEKSHKIF